jgi:phosphate transport system permease protein
MNNKELEPSPGAGPRRTIDIVNSSLARRYRAERRFRFYGLAAIVLSIVFLGLLFINIIGKGFSAFWQTSIRLAVFFDSEVLKQDILVNADYGALLRVSLANMFPQVEGRQAKRQLNSLVSSGSIYQLRDMVMKDRTLIGKTVEVWLPADDDVDMLIKGHIRRDLPESERRVSDMQISWIERLEAEGRL